MSCNSKMCGYSIKLSEELQNEEEFKKQSKLLGYEWEDDYGWDDIIYNKKEDSINKWKPHIDYYGKYGFIYLKEYDYEAYDVEFYAKITEMGAALKEYVSLTNILTIEEIKSFAIIYYNGSDCPFRY